MTYLRKLPPSLWFPCTSALVYKYGCSSFMIEYLYEFHHRTSEIIKKNLFVKIELVIQQYIAAYFRYVNHKCF